MLFDKLSIKYTGLLFILVIFTLLASMLFSVQLAGAIPTGALKPGTSFEKASGLGLTYPYAKINNGIKLDGVNENYYFTFTLESPSNVSVWFYSTQKPTSNMRYKGLGNLALFNSVYQQQGGMPTGSCPSGLYCYGSVTASNLQAGTYFLKVDMNNYRSQSGSTTGWLAWKVDRQDGTQPSSALAWYNRSDLYSQMPIDSRQQWYKLNMSSWQRGTIRLYGDTGSNLNIYLYSDSSTNRAFASGTLTNYPENFSFTVPAGAKFIYVKVDNASYAKSGSEYYIQLTR